MSARDAYRCDACKRRKNRCVECRARRAAAVRELHARKRADGDCLRCAEPAEPGKQLCAAHNDDNNTLSRKSHALARKRRRS
jgi:hypothetical protein